MTCENARFNCWFFSTPEVCGPVRICGDRICVATCLLSHPFPNGRIACRRARYQGHNRESQNVSTQDKDSCLAFSPWRRHRAPCARHLLAFQHNPAVQGPTLLVLIETTQHGWLPKAVSVGVGNSSWIINGSRNSPLTIRRLDSILQRERANCHGSAFVLGGSFRSLWAIGIAGGIHRYPKGFANPCLDCGFAEFVVPKNELHALVEGLTRLQTKRA